jgi:hypothetical protein
MSAVIPAASSMWRSEALQARGCFLDHVTPALTEQHTSVRNLSERQVCVLPDVSCFVDSRLQVLFKFNRTLRLDKAARL